MWISRVPSASNPGDGPSRGDITFVEALGAMRDQCMCPILDVVLQDLWLKRKVDVRLGMFWGWWMWKFCLSGDVALSHLFGMVMIRRVSQLETWVETDNDCCEWDRLETWMPILGIACWISNVLPHVTKRGWTWCPLLRLCLHMLFCFVMPSYVLYVWFMLRVIFPCIGFSMTYTWYIALLWRFATSVALVKVWFAPKVYLCKALIPFGVKTAECHGAPNL